MENNKGFWYWVLLPIMIIPWVLKFMSNRSVQRAENILRKTESNSRDSIIKREVLKAKKMEVKKRLTRHQQRKYKVSKDWHLEEDIEDEE